MLLITGQNFLFMGGSMLGLGAIGPCKNVSASILTKELAISYPPVRIVNSFVATAVTLNLF